MFMRLNVSLFLMTIAILLLFSFGCSEMRRKGSSVVEELYKYGFSEEFEIEYKLIFDEP